MAKLSAKKPSKTPLQKAYNKERNRLKRQVQALEKRGYRFAKNIVPDIPKKITEASLRRVKNITLDDLYKKSRYYGQALDYETRSTKGTSGVRGRDLERSYSAQKGAETRRRSQVYRLIDELARSDRARDYAREQGDAQSVSYIDKAIDDISDIHDTDYTGTEKETPEDTDDNLEYIDGVLVNRETGEIIAYSSVVPEESRVKPSMSSSMFSQAVVSNFRESLSGFAPSLSSMLDEKLDRMIKTTSAEEVAEALSQMPDTLTERIQSFNGSYYDAIQSYFDELGTILQLTHEEQLELASMSDEYEDGYDI